MLIVSENENEVLKAIKYLLDLEKIEYEISNSFENTKDDKVIVITINEHELSINDNRDYLLITNKKIDIRDFKFKCNEIITNLIDSNIVYTKSQEEYLFRDGIYSLINNIILDFINDKTTDKIIYDLSCCKSTPNDWIFSFDSIAETYSWLNRKNHELVGDLKVIDITNQQLFNTFNDSDKEIRYLSEYIYLAKKGMNLSTIFVANKDEIQEKMKNRFFKILACNCGENVKTYFCDIDVLQRQEPQILDKIRDGINIYDDCVYRDTYKNELSLGYVDCKLETVKEYIELYNYLKENYSILLAKGGEYVGI